MENKTQEKAEGEAEDPVADQIGDHGEAGFAEAAESAGGDDLNPVKDLEGGGQPEEAGADGKDLGVVGVELDEGAGGYEEDHRGREHEGGAEAHGEPSGAAGACGIAGTDCVADADGGCRRDTKRHHVSEGGVVEG